MSELVNGFDVSIVDKKMLKVGPAGIDIAYQRLGNPDAPLVAGVRRPKRFPGRSLF